MKSGKNSNQMHLCSAANLSETQDHFITDNAPHNAIHQMSRTLT
jgi:hypothetical protein